MSFSIFRALRPQKRCNSLKSQPNGRLVRYKCTNTNAAAEKTEDVTTTRIWQADNAYNTRVILPGPAQLSSEDPNPLYDEGTAENRSNEANADLSEQEILEKSEARLGRFRQAILDTHAELNLEHEEDLLPNEFPQGPLTIKGAFGTPEAPVLIPSIENERIVGCQGGAGPRFHDILWHTVKKSKPLCCLECGQIFRLVDYMEWLDWAAYEWEVNGQNTIQFFLPEQQ
ncbi:uncharacterized protein LOC126326584 [Schistocerca gregaria]|uniref:uncharacterized protein LOC126326584 n=1 Tax=Schistocerca gregaria TaxID=7010 RepID=UPI00211EDA12|nr:uncharacterized protein LOC126326584 [Schistocerca gregaria]